MLTEREQRRVDGLRRIIEVVLGGECANRCMDDEDDFNETVTALVKALSCEQCIMNANEHMAPRHEPSRRCESGKQPHCTCDACF